MIIWDQGSYAPLDSRQNPVDERSGAETLVGKGLKEGRLSFYLQGVKLKGIWTLVKLKRTEKDWLLIKHRDEFARNNGHP